MRDNHLLSLWKADKPAINGWLHIPSSWSAELMAHQGFDSLTVDMEHGMADFQTALTMFQAISTTHVTPLARVTWHDPGLMMRLLDAGCMGIICPMVNNREQAERFVGACRYHPQGYRSLGPTRARVYAGADYADHANEAVITLAMVETAEALANLEEICSTPGLTGVYVGPGDLSLSLGGTQRVDPTEPLLVEALDAILAACRRHGIVAGLHTNDPQYARGAIEKGFRFVTLMTDSTILATYAKQLVTAVRADSQATAEVPDSPY
ncbi:MAG: 2,4-dihydroxyhept-2-ene-1,7-dioic acid aldolase [Caldilineae bacterium]|nr:MAG: 2,4-dihydroxyhept-2-ene-1,7-dioic acid aldolase [Caldilineae bacterium]